MTAAAPKITWPLPFWPQDPAPADPLWPNEHHPWSSPMVEACLQRFSQPGDLVLDPFASQATLARVANAKRRRLLLNNASPATLLGVLASAAPPAAAVVDHAFSRIADAPRRGQTLAHHLAALYETICPECAQSIAAESFIWDHSIGEPVEKQYRCPHCGSQGDAPADMGDVAQVAALEVRGAAYWGLLSRLVKPGDPLTSPARSLQDLYPSRALLVFSELLTAAEQRLNNGEEQRAARAMILHTMTAGLPAASLHVSQEQARWQLPRRFVEHNLWLAFEHAHRTLRGRAAGETARRERPLPLAADLTRLRGPEGEGRVLPLALTTPELVEQLTPGSVALILSEPPPFDPASYALNFLWTGWLFGREAANRQRPALSIGQWSWDWYARAIAAALRALRPILAPDGRLLLAFADRSARRGLAVLTAAGAAGWRLTAQASESSLCPPIGQTQWRFELTPDDGLANEAAPALAERIQLSAQEAAHRLIETRAEPTPPGLVQTACAVHWSESGLLAELARHAEGARQPVSFLLAQMRLALTRDLPPPGLIFAPADPADPDQGGLWMAERPSARPPLADRVEQFIARQLENGPAPRRALIEAAYAAFPGWLTPDAELLAACLESYGQPEGDLLRLRDEDQPRQRDADLAGMLHLLANLGRRLSFTVEMAAPGQTAAEVIWSHAQEPAFAFAVVSQASLHPWLHPASDALAGCPRYVVLPGGRAALLDFKLRRCPPWRTQLAWTGWEFVKFRHLRELASQTGLSVAAFRARIGLDPVVTLPGQQLALFNLENQGDADDV